jgi:hypothetical protein
MSFTKVCQTTKKGLPLIASLGVASFASYEYTRFNRIQALTGDLVTKDGIRLFILNEWLHGKHTLTDEQRKHVLKLYKKENYRLGSWWPSQHRLHHNQAMWKIVHEETSDEERQQLPPCFKPYESYDEETCKAFDRLDEQFVHDVDYANFAADWPYEVYRDAIAKVHKK